MKKHLSFLILIISMSTVTYGQLAVGTVRKTVVTDNSGNVVSTPLFFSNQFSIFPTASNANEVVLYKQFTNTITIATNIYPLATTKGGTGGSTTVLTGSWTNSINFRVNGTNDANAYKVAGVLGFSGSVTNLGPGAGSSNVMVYATGMLTNKFTIP